MNTSSNPFEADLLQNINIDKFAQEMALTLKKLNTEKEKLRISDRNQHSDNSLGQFIRAKNLADQKETYKRENPVKVLTPVPRKRVRASSEYEGPMNDDSQFIDSISNRKITEFFNLKHKIVVTQVNKEEAKNTGGCPEDNDETELASHPVIKSLREKIAKKQKSIQELSNQVEKIRQKYQKTQQQIATKKQNQTQILINFLCQKYQHKIYAQKIEEMRKTQNPTKTLQKKILNQVTEKIDLLKNEKNIKKNTRNRNGNSEQANLLEIYGEQRQSYLAAWKKKLQNQKLAIEKQVQRVPLCQQIQLITEKYLSLPKYFLDEDYNRKIFQKYYLPLYCRSQGQPFTQIRALNLQKLCFENLTILSYPTTMRKQKRMQIKSRLRQLFTKSLHLDDEVSHSMFINNTIFSQIENLQKEAIVMGRVVWEQDLPSINLRHLMKRYEFMPENIAKYIVKTMLRAHQRIRKQLNHECILFPQNIIFNQRNDLKIDNWMGNEIHRSPEYNEHLHKTEKYLYLPPEYKLVLYTEETRNSGIGIWGIGVLLYEMLFGRKPFSYGKDVDHQEFFMMNQLEFPAKPQIGDACKELLRACLCKPQSRITCEKALKHSFFDFKK